MDHLYCWNCGGETRFSVGETVQRALCNDCEYNRDNNPNWKPQQDVYYSTECSMCGKEGASPRKDGRNYCGTCWTVWNS